MPNKRYSNTLNEVNKKFQRELAINTVDILVGDRSMASRVPVYCSCLMAMVKLAIAVLR